MRTLVKPEDTFPKEFPPTFIPPPTDETLPPPLYPDYVKVQRLNSQKQLPRGFSRAVASVLKGLPGRMEV